MIFCRYYIGDVSKKPIRESDSKGESIVELSQPHFGQSGRMQLPLPKVETWSPPGLPKTQKTI